MPVSHSKYEREYREAGYRCIAGVDEVGVGCLAGPVVAAAVIFDPITIPRGVDDSKALTARQRETLDVRIRQRAIAFALGEASVDEIDRINILQAARLAMRRAIEALPVRPDFLLIDGRFPLGMGIPDRALIGGDRLSVSIGAASIVAKVHRDAMMARFEYDYPGYGFAQHKGYGSVFHRKCLQERGPTPLHRKTFSWTPV